MASHLDLDQKRVVYARAGGDEMSCGWPIPREKKFGYTVSAKIRIYRNSF
jgi:hypothetical protein